MIRAHRLVALQAHSTANALRTHDYLARASFAYITVALRHTSQNTGQGELKIYEAFAYALWGRLRRRDYSISDRNHNETLLAQDSWR